MHIMKHNKTKKSKIKINLDSGEIKKLFSSKSFNSSLSSKESYKCLVLNIFLFPS